MDDLISKQALKADLLKRGFFPVIVKRALQDAPAVDAVSLPCKIGDRVWAIRNYKGVRHPQESIVNEMFFTPDMRLIIVVKCIARGEWGETVFGTYEECQRAIEGKENEHIKED